MRARADALGGTNMRFIRNGRIRERIIDVVAKGILIAFSALVCLWMISGARASQGAAEIQEIRQQAGNDGSHSIELILTRAVSKGDVSVDFQRNFVQVSLKGVNAYPARTEQLNHAVMDKVFTYQYQPDLARARILLKTQASSVRARSSWEVDGKTVRVIVHGERREAAAGAAKDSVRNRSAAAAEKAMDPAEEKIRNQILRDAAADTDTAPASGVSDPESLPIFGSSGAKGAAIGAGDSESPAAKIFGALLLIVGVIGAGSLAFRKFVLGRGMTFQRQGKMIEVISSQALGPKRSIALVKVLDQFMVVGMSGEGMTLLANLGTSVNLERFTDEGGASASFRDTLESTLSDERQEAPPPKERGRMDLGFRASIKKRLEGFKPL
jgi:flagellar biogenesis protein FliO